MRVKRKFQHLKDSAHIAFSSGGKNKDQMRRGTFSGYFYRNLLGYIQLNATLSKPIEMNNSKIVMYIYLSGSTLSMTSHGYNPLLSTNTGDSVVSNFWDKASLPKP